MKLKNPVNLKLEKKSLYFLFIQINVAHNWWCCKSNAWEAIKET
nr:MAG TPA: hypothetical protein [Caudoviricetes sp.]